MVGPAEYSRFTTDLREGRAALVIDAFDEAEAISGRTAIQQFIKDLNRCIDGAVSPCAFLFSRTETAQFIASLCAEISIPFLHYEIGFFEETQSLQFMEGQLSRLKKANNPNVSVTAAERDCIKKYYDAIQQNISTNERASFLGYAPVLQAISSEIKETSNTASLISKLSGKVIALILLFKSCIHSSTVNKKKLPRRFRISVNTSTLNFPIGKTFTLLRNS